MAGHFVLNSITVSDLQTAQIKGCGWSGLAHGVGAQNAPGQPAHTGWNAGTRANLTQALGAGVANRNQLPPHRYLTFGPFAAVGGADMTRDYVRGAGWTANLSRPPMGLAALCPAAQVAWLANDKDGAVLAQGLHGATSIEVYYTAGYEMT